MKKILFAILFATPSLFCMEESDETKYGTSPTNSEISMDSITDSTTTFYDTNDVLTLVQGKTDLCKFTNNLFANQSEIPQETYHSIIGQQFAYKIGMLPLDQFNPQATENKTLDRLKNLWNNLNTTNATLKAKLDQINKDENIVNQKYTTQITNLQSNLDAKALELDNKIRESKKFEESFQSEQKRAKKLEENLLNAKADGIAKTTMFFTALFGFYMVLTKTSFFDYFANLFWNKLGITN